MRLLRWIIDWYNREMDAAVSRGIAGMGKYLSLPMWGTSFNTLREAQAGPSVSSYLGLVGHIKAAILPSGSVASGHVVMSSGTALDDALLAAPSGINRAEFAEQWVSQFLGDPKPHMVYDRPEAAKEEMYRLHRLNMLSAEETARKTRMTNYPGDVAPGGKYHFVEGEKPNDI